MTNNIPLTLPVGGDGLWSSWKGKVDGELVLTHNVCIHDDAQWCEAEFSLTEDWYPDRGLIYTDQTFMEALQAQLKELGFEKGSIGYSEQGMQGEYFVHFDADHDLLAEAKRLGYDVWLTNPDYREEDDD